MGFDAKKWGGLGFAILKSMVPAIGVVEESVKILAGKVPGASKQEAVINLVKGGLTTAETFAGELLDDVEVEAATRAAIDAQVHLHNVIAIRKQHYAELANAAPRD